MSDKYVIIRDTALVCVCVRVHSSVPSSQIAKEMVTPTLKCCQWNTQILSQPVYSVHVSFTLNAPCEYVSFPTHGFGGQKPFKTAAIYTSWTWAKVTVRNKPRDTVVGFICLSQLAWKRKEVDLVLCWITVKTVWINHWRGWRNRRRALTPSCLMKIFPQQQVFI